MMKIKCLKLVVVVGAMATLAGCLEDKAPEPNADNCAPIMYQKILRELSKESSKNEFIANCKSFTAAREMTDWKFEKSPEDDF